MDEGPRDPYREVWQMTPVGDAAGHGRKSHPIAAIVAALVVFMPFAIIIWFVWGASVQWSLLIGLFGLLCSGAVAYLVGSEHL